MSYRNSEIQSELILAKHSIGPVEFLLHPYGGMYWEKYATLFVSDAHFGKVMHFRKNGIAVPTAAIDENWEKLDAMIQRFTCKKVVFLGDLFHSDENIEWDHFISLINVYSGIEFQLVRGNHDILDEEKYALAGINVVESLEIEDFYFSHHPEDVKEKYNIHGHIHPGVLLRGKGMASKKLACFYFSEKRGIMPAFGSFTGTMRVEVKEGDAVFILLDDRVISM